MWDLIGAVLGGMLAIIGVGGLIVGGVIWLGHRAMQRQAADMADEAGESDQQAQRKGNGGGGGPTEPA